MNLYVCRHAEAMRLGGDVLRDADRMLSEQGTRDAALLGQVLARLDPNVSRILTSPLRRAVQTAELIAQPFSRQPSVVSLENLLPGFRHKSLYEELMAGYALESIIVVGHQPDLSRFISYLVSDAAVSIAMAPASVARLTVQPNAPQPDATLDWVLPPGVLRTFYPQQ